MSTRAIYEGLRTVEVPIPYEERAGDSKLHVVRDGTRFLQSIIWTSLAYNPSRLLAGMGLLCWVAAVGIATVLVATRLRGIAYLGPFGVASVFVAVVLGIAGVDLFGLGTAFNYMVSLFHRRPVRQGLFGHPLFRVPLDRHSWWMGLLLTVAGVALGLASLSLGLNGAAVERCVLPVGGGDGIRWAQLVLFWVIMRVLGELSQRESDAADLRVTA